MILQDMEKSMNFYGRLYRMSCFLIRRFYPTYRIVDKERLADPSVYLCRHFNTQGLFMTIPWLPGKIHTWSLHLYHDRKACFRHMMDYTLTERFGWPKWKAWLASIPIASFLQALMRSARAIPVYRNSMQIMKTYKMSLSALKNGESVLIFPDREYTSMNDEIGGMYEGFLMIDRLYFRETGRHIPFVPVYADAQTRTIQVGMPILFSGDAGDRTERRRVFNAIRSQLSGANNGSNRQAES
jgi:hypothetical protein